MSKIVGVALIAILATVTVVTIGFAAYSPASVMSVWNWLLAPISGASEHHVSLGTSWHGRLMVFAWAFLMTVGLVIARFYKITPTQDWPRHLDNPFWFVNHRRLGYCIAVITTLGVALILWDKGKTANYHGPAGWAVFALGWFQIIGALFRGTHGGSMDSFTRQPRPPEQWPGDHFSMTKRRIVFEYSHKLVGCVLVPLAGWTVYSGLYAADAPRWMWIAISFWWLIFLGVVVHLQRAGKCIDTYQAIWGLDDTLPGYRRQPIGWGIRRVTKASNVNEDYAARDGCNKLTD